jgi:hypothetical protein
MSCMGILDPPNLCLRAASEALKLKPRFPLIYPLVIFTVSVFILFSLTMSRFDCRRRMKKEEKAFTVLVCMDLENGEGAVEE